MNGEAKGGPDAVRGAGRACGPGGYADLLVTLADRGDAQHADMVAWLGGPFDPEVFDAATVWFDNPRRRWRKAFGDG